MQNNSTDAVDCTQALNKLFDMLDGELTPEVEAKMREHVVGCPHCFTQADFEKRFLAALSAVRAGRSASGSLRSRVLEALKAEGLAGA